jgi:predicted transcriptional regulator
MTTRYRGKHEIMFSILESCDREGGQLVTRVMYEAYVSHSQLRQYMSAMTEQGLLLKHEGKYHITPKGRRAYELTKELDGILRV